MTPQAEIATTPVTGLITSMALPLDRQPAGMVRFWVCDHAPGLTPEAQSLLFMPFMHLDQVQLQEHGLGLPIVRRIVEKLGGKLD